MGPQHNVGVIPQHNGGIGPQQAPAPHIQTQQYATIADSNPSASNYTQPQVQHAPNQMPQNQWNGPAPLMHTPSPAAQAVPGAEIRQHEETEQELARLRAELKDIKTAVAELSRPSQATGPTTISGEQLSAAISSLDDQVGEIRSLLDRPSADSRSVQNNQLAAQLTDIGFNAHHAKELASRMDKAVPGATLEDGDFRETLQRMIADDLLCGGGVSAGSDRRRVMAFVGPTGVGKTTTIAKVASEACLRECVSLW